MNTDFEETKKCPICNEAAEYDLKEWPPKIERKKSIVSYECPNGHKFEVEYDLK